MRIPQPVSADYLYAASSIIKSFVSRERRERYLALLESQGGRKRIRSKLPHFRDFDPRVTIPIAPSSQTLHEIYRLLKERGAPENCHIWSSSSSLNGSFNLAEALSRIVGWEPGTIVLCLVDQLGYYEGEDQNERSILYKLDHRS